MATSIAQVHKDIRRNRQSKYDKLIRQNADADMTAFRRMPYYLKEEPNLLVKGFCCSYPFSFGDEVYEIYAGKIYPLRVIGFCIMETGEYVMVRDEQQGMGETQIALSNIFLSRKLAQEELERRQEENDR